MRELFPEPAADVDPVERYQGDERSFGPGGPGRPWVLVNMIATADGATAVQGRSGGLGGAADKRVFAAIRSVPDVILVGAGTVRAESYGPPSTPPNRPAPPRLAIVTRSLDLDLTRPLFTAAAPDARPMVVTTEQQRDPGRLAEVEAVAEVVVAGDTDVDVNRALSALGDRGARVVLCEGGPSLNGQLVAVGAVDELCMTLAPLVAGGSSPRLAQGVAPPDPHSFHLDRVLEADSYLFLRYVREGALSAVSGPSTS